MIKARHPCRVQNSKARALAAEMLNSAACNARLPALQHNDQVHHQEHWVGDHLKAQPPKRSQRRRGGRRQASGPNSAPFVGVWLRRGWRKMKGSNRMVTIELLAHNEKRIQEKNESARNASKGSLKKSTSAAGYAAPYDRRKCVSQHLTMADGGPLDLRALGMMIEMIKSTND